jgi:hypothetical protein
MRDESEPLGKADEIRLSRKAVPVPWEKRKELADRLAASGFAHAADDLRSRRAFTETDKPHVLGVLNAWFDEVKIDVFGRHLQELRLELDHDVSRSQR